MTFESDDNVDTGATENTAAEVETEQTEWQPEQQTEGDDHKTELSDEEKAKQEAEQKGEQEEKPKRNRAQERIQQLAREKAEMAAELAEYKAKVNQPVQASERPSIADYDDINDYYKAVDEYQIDQAVARMEQKQSKASEQKQQIQKQSEFEAVITTVAETYPDFDSVVQAGLQRDLPMPLTLDEVASEFGYSPETQVKLLYEIGKNETLHETLSGSSKLKAARILSELVDSWETKPAPKVSKAPPPIKPVQANAPAARNINSMSDSESVAYLKNLKKGK